MAVSYTRTPRSSCFDQAIYGCKTGFTTGFIFTSIMSSGMGFYYGLRGTTLIKETAKSAVQGGATFGLFMTIAALVRC